MAPSLLSCLLLITIAMASFVSSQNGGFTVDLIHRDASLPPSERIANAVRRSVNRVHRLNPTSSSSVHPNQVESTVTMDYGSYLMEISIGTPPFPIKGIADTGSDLIWTQCKPCPGCYKQTDPLFDPRKSSTFETLPCRSSLCRSSEGFCTERSSSCQYAVQYGDGSHSNGVIATETLTLDSSTGRAVAFPKTVIGCGFDNNGSFKEDGSGIIGLGGGPESLISQLESSINGKFSHCLVPIWSEKITTSKMSFGSNAVVSGPGVASTPIVRDTENPTFYFLTLKSISVGNNTKIPFPGIEESEEGNIIIDSGTTLTVLPQEMVEDLNAAVQEAIGSRYEVKEGEGPFSLCYESSKSEEFEAPILTLHFAGGADVKLDTLHTFVQINDDTVCLSFGAFRGLRLNRAIYGNLHQMNYLVGYDVKKDTVSFKPADCTKFQ